MPADEAAALALLTGPDAADVLAAALGTAGVDLVEHEVHRVHHRPGDGVTVGYQVSVRAPSGAVAQEYLLVSSSRGRDVRPEARALVRLDGPGGRLLAWRHPDDPALPALRRACDPALLAHLLPGAGAVTRLALVGYRPLRRAVLRADKDGHPHWVKVLRPGARRGGAPDVVHRHGLLAAAGLPVPRVVSSSADGLVVLEHLAGTSLVAAVGTDDAAGVELGDLLAILDALPPTTADLPRRPPWSERADSYAAGLVASVRDGPDPGLAARAGAVARSVGEWSHRVDLGPVVATHGDLHAGQLLVDRRAGGWAPAGLLDVDTVGPGRRVDDLACLLAHAVAMGPPAERVLARWDRAARAAVDAAALDVRTAGVLLSLAVGAAHGHGPRPADELLAEAERRLPG